MHKEKYQLTSLSLCQRLFQRLFQRLCRCEFDLSFWYWRGGFLCVCVCKETKMEPSLLDIRIIRFGRHIHIVTKRNTMRLFCSLVSCVFLLLFLLFSSKLVGVLLSFFFLLTVASLCCSSFPAMF